MDLTVISWRSQQQSFKPFYCSIFFLSQNLPYFLFIYFYWWGNIKHTADTFQPIDDSILGDEGRNHPAHIIEADKGVNTTTGTFQFI